MSINHDAIKEAALKKTYGMSYAKAYALCLDSGMLKEDAEYRISFLVQQITLQGDYITFPDSAVVHELLKEHSSV